MTRNQFLLLAAPLFLVVCFLAFCSFRRRRDSRRKAQAMVRTVREFEERMAEAKQWKP